MIKFILNYPKCTKNKVNKSNLFFSHSWEGKRGTTLRGLWVKRVSDRPPFIFIAVRPDTDHSDGTGARQIERRAVNGQKALNIVNNYKIEQNYQLLVFFCFKQLSTVNNAMNQGEWCLCYLSPISSVQRPSCDDSLWQLMMCCDSFSSRHLQPPSVLGILTFVTTRSRACAERKDQQALVTDEERVRDDHLVPGGYRNMSIFSKSSWE